MSRSFVLFVGCWGDVVDMDLKRKHEELLADEGAAEASVSRVRSFPIGNVHTYNVVCDSGDATEDPPAYLEWFVRFNAAVGKAEDGKLKAAVGLDCEWVSWHKHILLHMDRSVYLGAPF